MNIIRSDIRIEVAKLSAICFAICGLLIFAPLPARSETLVLRSVADSTLLESAPDFNMGRELHAAAGTTGSMGEGTRNRSLFKFDLSAIPAQAQIRSVSLTLEVVWVPGRDGGGGPVNSTFALHRLLRNWGEGTKLGFRGEFATAGEVTWNHSEAPGLGTTGGSKWSSPGAAAPADFIPEPSATQFVSGVGSHVFGPADGLVVDVKAWVENPKINFGWLLVSQSESRLKTARRFGSRENAKAAPKLTVEFALPETLKIDDVRKLGDHVQFQFTGEVGRAYVVQFRSLLAEGTWLVLTNIAAPQVRTNLTILDPIIETKRFYRVGQF